MTRKVIKRSLEVRHCDSFIDHETFYLMKNWAMRCIKFVSSECATWADHVDRRLLREH